MKVRKTTMKLFYFCLLSLCGFAESSRILLVFSSFSPSHFILGNALGRGLANGGHQVTVVSPFEDKNPPKNYRNVVLTGFTDKQKGNHPKFFDMENMHPWLGLFVLNSMGKTLAEETLKHPTFRALLNEQFDLIVLDQFRSDALRALSCHFDAPLIMFSTIGANSWVNVDVANPSPPSYVPAVFLGYSSKMDLWQRTFNFLTYNFAEINDHFLYRPVQRELIKTYLPKCGDFDLHNVSLYFLNSHESYSEAIPLVPNTINVGGYHIQPPKNLTGDLKAFLDSAKDGVVYFSLGSNIKPSEMKPEIREAVVKSLGKLKQKVLWKYDGDELPGKPDNVKLGKWLPQTDILAHPNIKVFITHGGLLSSLETIYHGVPILAIPVFGDQKLNAARAEKLGYGLKLSYSEITESSLSEALDKLLYDPKYRDNAKMRSKLSHDRPMKPMDLILYWTDYVVRHKGADHLMVAGVNLPWYQYLILDVVLLLIVLTLVPLIVLYLVCRRLCCSRTSSKKKKE
ncbi:unnamed protein product [Phyllotreta striolata]|uniref:UDP-glucuronosyltransferase n=1 Tax=Phyllotreta striolata TaxID=444603 RepID=A0A9N9TIP3_PHYSR|nr:unnamed protein product [Phyllotreta striolata]